jgi:hypothetical protein
MEVMLCHEFLMWSYSGTNMYLRLRSPHPGNLKQMLTQFPEVTNRELMLGVGRSLSPTELWWSVDNGKMYRTWLTGMTSSRSYLCCVPMIYVFLFFHPPWFVVTVHACTTLPQALARECPRHSNELTPRASLTSWGAGTVL